MDSVISEYQKWKQQGQSLRVQAKQAMEQRFRDLLLESARIAQEYHRDFGATLKPPPTITAFRYKAVPGIKPKAVAKTAALPKHQTTQAKPKAPNPKIAGLTKQRAAMHKKIEAAKAAGKATKNLDDRLYEIEDELRLASESE